MEAISKTGKRLHGKIAEILVKKGSATPFEDEPGEIQNQMNADEKAEAERIAREADEKKKLELIKSGQKGKGKKAAPKKIKAVKKVVVKKVKK